MGGQDLALIAAALTTGVASAAWAVRGRSSQVFGESRWRGTPARRAIALTFDDGPSEGTLDLLEVLSLHKARATFFQVGVHAERHPEIARAVSQSGHEVGNHTYSHTALWLRSSAFIEGEIARAQQSLTALHSSPPAWFRAPYGVRWPGLAAAQRRHNLTGVMWTAIARDWVLPAEAIVQRLRRAVRSGAIFCLHDGRALRPNPDIRPTVAALRQLLPLLRQQGYDLVTVSQLLCPPISTNA
jgi:peptidoglycan/xylan/chitin deacetylase (PgdA/CDA1 family)